MGDELGDPSNEEELTASELFWKVFPSYLVIGMTSEEFWRGEPRLAEAYREAFEIRRDNQLNAELRSGRYVYEALLAASPAFREFSRGIRHDYPEEPLYTLSHENADYEIQREKRTMETNLAMFQAYATAHNVSMRQSG